ncbi:MAG: hypothetical protein B0W54_10060 [Cellvibrio sp. 79]|nr:MAG: hypothetical protein B0W54_10060 [Cellvibrio sp. 79]
MIHLTELKSLMLAQGTHADRHPHLSAASGLVQVGPWLYVVADDELHLGQFLLKGNEHGQLHRFFEGDLPVEYEERKAEKPDIEVLTLIPHFNNSKQSALLAMGSGSKKKRRRSALATLDHTGSISGEPSIIDLSNFYDFLKQEVGKLNIEGAAVVQDQFFLFQRGNKKNKLNASIRLSLNDFYRVLQEPHKTYQPQIDITPYDLGYIDDVPLCFTDATTLQNGAIVFTASAENTSDSYLDGQCMGSAIGIIDRKGDLVLLEPIDKTVKLEGIEADELENKVELLLVTDADDAAHPAQLYSASVKYPG